MGESPPGSLVPPRTGNVCDAGTPLPREAPTPVRATSPREHAPVWGLKRSFLGFVGSRHLSHSPRLAGATSVPACPRCLGVVTHATVLCCPHSRASTWAASQPLPEPQRGALPSQAPKQTREATLKQRPAVTSTLGQAFFRPTGRGQTLPGSRVLPGWG